MKSLFSLCVLFFAFSVTAFAKDEPDPVSSLLERIDEGASKKFVIEISDPQSPVDFFELDMEKKKIRIRGNNYISIATGLNWYLKYHVGIHLSWNGMKAKLPARLPEIRTTERRETDKLQRFYLNYCTFSYSMALWDWKRWEQEIDWMALHGINLPLAVTGSETVWYNLLKRLDYSKEEISQFIAGSGFQAWWLMNNLEGWGGPNPDRWYEIQVDLQRRILDRYREWGIEPVMAGYSGMVPSNAKEKLSLDVKDPGLWCGYNRPAFLMPTDPNFKRIAKMYYEEQQKLFGRAKYYSMDPFHEGGATDGVDFTAAGDAIISAVKAVNPGAVWVVQAWQANPRPEMIEQLPGGDVLVLDLNSESRPQWGDPESIWYRKDGFGKHDWLYCMILNFGGNVGLHGKMDLVINGYYDALTHPNGGRKMTGVGATMEAIENNPVMYELLLELPWRKDRFTKEEWLRDWVKARYGEFDPAIYDAWLILSKTSYNGPRRWKGEGTTESVFCGRPSLDDTMKVSTWGTTAMYYDAKELLPAVAKLLSVAERFRGNNNFEYDLIDITRQAAADKANRVRYEMAQAYKAGDMEKFGYLSDEFLNLLMMQDNMLSSRPEFMVGTWLDKAYKKGRYPSERAMYEWNARTQITSWGDRTAANEGGLQDYSHREWSGILKDLYYKRWSIFIEKLKSGDTSPTDWYAIEEEWNKQNTVYPTTSQADPIDMAKIMYSLVR